MAVFNPNLRPPVVRPAARPPGRQFATADPERQREVDAATPQDRDPHGRTQSHSTTSGLASTRGRRGGEESVSEDEAVPLARGRR